MAIHSHKFDGGWEVCFRTWGRRCTETSRARQTAETCWGDRAGNVLERRKWVRGGSKSYEGLILVFRCCPVQWSLLMIPWPFNSASSSHSARGSGPGGSWDSCRLFQDQIPRIWKSALVADEHLHLSFFFFFLYLNGAQVICLHRSREKKDENLFDSQSVEVWELVNAL